MLLDGERDPTHDIGESGLGQYVGDAVGHTEIGADGPVERAVKDGEHVCRGASDIDADQVPVLPFGNGFHDQAHCGRGRHNRGACPAHQLLVPGCLGHHVLQEEIVNLVPRRGKVLALQDRPEVLRHDQGGFLGQHFRDPLPSVLVAGINQGNGIPHTQPRSRFGRRNVLSQLHHMGDGPSIGAARQQDHIRAKGSYPLNLLVWEAAVVRGQNVHHDGTGTQGAALRALRRHGLNRARHHHL